VHNQGVTAIAWTLVGLMAGSLGVLSTALFSGLGRIDALGARLDARMDSQSTELRGEMRGLRADIGEVRQAVTSLDQRLTRAGG
jgi:hypothetical protein